MTKICTACKEEKPVSDFGKARAYKDGIKSECRTCSRERGRKYREENREKVREEARKYYEENKEKIGEERRKYYEENKEKIGEERRKYYEENRDGILSGFKEYQRKNCEISNAMATKSGRWSQEEVDLLVELRKTKTIYQCAIELERGYGPTKTKIAHLRKQGVEI